jgi:hypothetical protein
MKRQQEWMHVVLGSWVLLSPWVLKLTTAHGVAAWCTSLLGTALLALAAPRVLGPKVWEEASTALLGLALLVSPWILDFTGQTGPTVSAVIAGLLAVALGMWPWLSESGGIHWRRPHNAP